MYKVPLIFPERLLPVYARCNLSFSHGAGAYLYDDDGQEYLDFASGIGVNILGYGHPSLLSALTSAAHKPWHVSNMYRTIEAERLADLFCSRYGFDCAFFCNSGTEAVETMVKSILAYKKEKQKPEIIVFDGAFHGRGLASTWASHNHSGLYDAFGHPIEQFRYAERNMESVVAIISENTGGIILEPLQGHNGCSEFEDDMLRALRRLCDERDLLLCYDCAQSGYGRTGDFFAYERSGAHPDIAAVAKGMAGGLPMGACFFGKRAATMTLGQHGSTQGGNPLCCSLANIVWQEVHDLLPHITSMSRVLDGMLSDLMQKYPHLITDLSGRGLLRSIILPATINAKEVGCMLLGSGLTTVPSDRNSLRLLPPYIIKEEDISRSHDILREVFSKLSPINEE